MMEVLSMYVIEKLLKDPGLGSKKEIERLADEVLALRQENAKLRDLARWRSIKDELPPKRDGYMVADVANPNDTNWWADFWNGKTWTTEGDGVWTHWKPLGPLPGEE